MTDAQAKKCDAKCKHSSERRELEIDPTLGWVP
jgi:hypothetical protein